jgi:hypothetical protein
MALCLSSVVNYNPRYGHSRHLSLRSGRRFQASSEVLGLLV